MVYGKVAVGIALGAVALSSPALAQETRKLDFGLTASVEHNSNVARTTKEQAELRGLSLADTIFTPSANVDILLPVGRQSVFLSGVAGYSFYDKNDELNRERLNLTGGVNGRVGLCSGTFTAGYARGVSEVDDPTLDRVENIRETDSLGVSVTCARETGFGVVAGASKDWISNELALAKESDSERTSYMAGVIYQRPAFGALTVFANHDETTYPNRIIDDGYDLNAIGVTFDRQLGARIQGTVTVAYTKVDPHAVSPFVSDDNLETTAYSASLSYRASTRLRLQAMFDRSVTPSTAVGRAYDLMDAYRISGDYDLGSRIKVNLGASRVQRDAEGVLGLPIVQLTDSETDTIYGSVRYMQSDRLSFTLNAGREERTTNTPQFDYTNNRVGLTADVAF